MVQFVDTAVNWFTLLRNPMSWHMFYRKLFVLTFPISIPLWLLVMGLFHIVGIVILVGVGVTLAVLTFAAFLHSIWHKS